MLAPLRWETHYGKNDGDGHGHGMKSHAKNQSHLYSNTKRKWQTSYFCGSTFSPFHSLTSFPRAQESLSESKLKSNTF